MVNYTWSFDPIVSAFPQTVLPNVALWNVSNGIDLNYQIQLSWPLDWTSRNETNVTALPMYIVDGNALGMTATEAWRRRDAVELAQPDYIVVSIGYPITDSAYGTQRYIDLQPVTPGEAPPAEPGVRPGADDFLDFIEHSLKPFVGSQFPHVDIGREALYGHSFGGQFVVYALLTRPALFDTFFASNPALYWNDQYILNHTYWLDENLPANATSKPALRIAYGDIEQYPVRRRTETDEQWDFRTTLYASLAMTDNCNALYAILKDNPALRDIVLKVYVGSDHASVAGVGLADGIDYFVDW